MPSIGEIVRTYRELAEIYDCRGEAQMRDRYLVLAADAALTAGRSEEAERLRGVLLQHNPHHLLKPYTSLAEALKSNDVRNYVAALRRSHPYERAEHLLETLSEDAGAEQTGHKTDVPAPARAKPAQAQKEELQIFRVQDEGDPRSGAVHARLEKLSGVSKPSPAVHQPARAPEIYALRPEPPGLAPDRSATGENQEHRVSVWVSLALFLLVLAVGVLGALYTLIRPFML